MKAITLYQPWASLVAIGAKRIETRSWSTRYRGPLAIHAGMNSMHMNLIMEHPFSDVFGNEINRFPFGAVVAVCRLIICEIIPPTGRRTISLTHGYSVPPSSPELEFGDYTPGRWAWILDEVRMMPEPIPASGMLGLWNWEMPGELRSTLDGKKETTQGTRKGDLNGQ